MKHLTFLSMGVISVFTFFPIAQLYAQSPASRSLPQVPITYTGDTAETIARRAQWLEGAKKEGMIDWWGILTPVEGGKVIAEFNKVYPFIKINYWRGKGEEVAAKLDAEFAAGTTSADISLGGEPYNYPRWRKMGVLEKFTDLIPGIKNIDKRMYGKFGDWMMPGNSAITPAYNTKKVSAVEAPKGWEDILDPKWKGQIALTTDMKAWTTLAFGEGGWGIEKTESFLIKLRQQQLIWGSGHSAAHALLIAGDFKIFGESYVWNTLQAQEKGAPGILGTSMISNVKGKTEISLDLPD